MEITRVFSIIVVIIGSFCLIQARTSSSFSPLLQTLSTLKSCEFDKIYQLGDSLSHTGNLTLESPVGVTTPYGRLPYGESFYENSTGRCCNGMLMIDHIAMASDLPLLSQSLQES